MKIEEALRAKKAEIDELQKDIDSLNDQSSRLKESVQKYNDLKSKAAELKKIKRAKQKEFNVVTSFFNSVDDNYLNEIFPLFAGQIKQTHKEVATA